MIASLKRWMYTKALHNHPNFNIPIDKTHENQCKTVAVFADSTQDSDRAIVDKYLEKLAKICHKVDVLYFINTKQPSEEGYSRKDIKWNSVPVHHNIDDFLSHKYDILICLLPDIDDHHRYIITLAQAQLKIGIQEENDEADLFDLMIDRSMKSDLRGFIDQIDINLKLISSP